MRRCLFLALAATAVALGGCATGTTVSSPSGPAPAATPPAASVPGQATETREVRGFTGVELTSFGDLQIEQTGTESLTIDAAPDVLPRLTSEVSGGVLRLGLMPGATVQATTPVVYRLTVATLDAIAVSGAGDVTAANLQADRLAVDVRGAGDVTLAGTVDTQVVTLRGAGDYDGENLASGTAEITVAGAGDAVVRVRDRLDATVRGAGSVEYIGDPEVTQDVRGVGSVQRR